MRTTNDIVQKLWNLCSLLREDGVTYHRWDDLASKSGMAQLDFYKRLLLNLGALGSPRVRDIYSEASTSPRQPKTLTELVKHLDGPRWYSETREHMVESMVALVRPQPGERVQDPAAGRRWESRWCPTPSGWSGR